MDNPCPNPQYSEPSPEGKSCILCVEDSPSQALVIKKTLEDAGYVVVITESGFESLELADKVNPDLIILDIILPDLDGYSVCRRLRMQSGNYIPVLMLSARRDLEDRLDGLEVGADDYLPKPFDRRELLARAKSLLRIKRLNQEMQVRLSEAEESFNIWRQVAITDHLTGLHNRHYLSKAVQSEFDVVDRYGSPLCMLMLDIDHFRDFNNKYGHLIGDAVLRGLGRILSSQIRRSDVVARYGGEEFVMLLPMTDLEAGASMAERVRRRVEAESLESDEGPLRITISIGVAGLPDEHIKSPKELFAKADEALYLAKEHGRNQVVVLGSGCADNLEAGEKL